MYDESKERYYLAQSNVTRLESKLDAKREHVISVEREKRERDEEAKERQAHDLRLSDFLEQGLVLLKQKTGTTASPDDAAGDVSQGKEKQETRKGGAVKGGQGEWKRALGCLRACVTTVQQESPLQTLSGGCLCESTTPVMSFSRV